jgi:hypothetical protein
MMEMGEIKEKAKDCHDISGLNSLMEILSVYLSVYIHVITLTDSFTDEIF